MRTLSGGQIKLRLANCFVAALMSCALLSSQEGAAQESGGHPCQEVVTCDCDSIEAGLLNSGWKADCRNCEKGIIEACEAAYPPLSSAMAAGGYCEKTCSVTGPNPYPRAPAEAAGDDDISIAKIGTMRLQCPATMKLSVIEIDGKKARGCKNDKGKPYGVWFIVDESAGTVTEIIYVDGVEVERTTRPLT